jgi:hypothetical protein
MKVLVICGILVILLALGRREGMEAPKYNTEGSMDVWPSPILQCAQWDTMYPNNEKFRGEPYCYDRLTTRCTKQNEGECPQNFLATRIGDIVRKVKFDLLGVKGTPSVCQGTPLANYTPKVVDTNAECEAECVASAGCRGYDTLVRRNKLQCNLFQGDITTAPGTADHKGCYERL